MVSSRSLILFLGVLYSGRVANAQFPVFNVDCSLYPGPCNNNCYAIFVAGKASNLNWDTPTKQVKRDRRTAAGCTPNPCCGTIDKPSDDETSCDEYPYASTVEGGAGSILRCTDVDENLNEGRALGGFLTSGDGCGGVQCTFTVMNTGAGTNSPYCLDEGGANDGFEYKLENGAYVQAKRDAAGNVYHERHVPDPAIFFPLEKRREFMLDNGKRGLLVSRDLETSYEGSTVVTGYPNGTVSVAKVVRELHGMDKSPSLRPSHIRPRVVEASKTSKYSLAASRLFGRQGSCTCMFQGDGSDTSAGTYCDCGGDGAYIAECTPENGGGCAGPTDDRACTLCGEEFSYHCCENGLDICQDGSCVEDPSPPPAPTCNPDDPEGDPDGLGDPPYSKR